MQPLQDIRSSSAGLVARHRLVDRAHLPPAQSLGNEPYTNNGTTESEKNALMNAMSNPATLGSRVKEERE
jgi:hypothetical protein